ncbi:ParH-like protein [Streptomyces sp. NPDC021356]|uniref:ParH-like protein n=1 Tax=Streptomyces sp. NPDC021356 TaxID=3154900 RepID=UPI0033CF8EA4
MGADRSARRLWRRCSRLVDGLDLPAPFDAGAFIALVARTRGRDIQLMPVAYRPHTPCGLLITTDHADCILYAADTTPLHQQHILLHEAAHLVCGHHETSPAASAAAELLLPHLPSDLVRRVLGRTVYTLPQEAEAELVASLILNRASRLQRTQDSAPPPGQDEARLRSLFGTPPPAPPGDTAGARPGRQRRTPDGSTRG